MAAACIGAASGSRPVHQRNCAIACATSISSPPMVPYPHARASRRSRVSSGVAKSGRRPPSSSRFDVRGSEAGNRVSGIGARHLRTAQLDRRRVQSGCMPMGVQFTEMSHESGDGGNAATLLASAATGRALGIAGVDRDVSATSGGADRDRPRRPASTRIARRRFFNGRPDSRAASGSRANRVHADPALPFALQRVDRADRARGVVHGIGAFEERHLMRIVMLTPATPRAPAKARNSSAVCAGIGR